MLMVRITVAAECRRVWQPSWLLAHRVSAESGTENVRC